MNIAEEIMRDWNAGTRKSFGIPELDDVCYGACTEAPVLEEGYENSTRYEYSDGSAIIVSEDICDYGYSRQVLDNEDSVEQILEAIIEHADWDNETPATHVWSSSFDYLDI